MVDPYDDLQTVQAQEITMADEEFSDERVAQMTTLDAATHYPSQFNISANSNEVTIVGGATRILMENGKIAPIVKLEYNLILKLSPPAAKDLLMNLANMMEQYEASYGKLDTDTLRRVRGDNEQK